VCRPSPPPESVAYHTERAEYRARARSLTVTTWPIRGRHPTGEHNRISPIKGSATTGFSVFGARAGQVWARGRPTRPLPRYSPLVRSVHAGSLATPAFARCGSPGGLLWPGGGAVAPDDYCAGPARRRTHGSPSMTTGCQGVTPRALRPLVGTTFAVADNGRSVIVHAGVEIRTTALTPVRRGNVANPSHT